MDQRVPRGWLRGAFEATFPAASADGFSFDVTAHGRWRRIAFRQHNPQSAATSYVIEEVSRLAVTCSVLAASALTHKANAHLGRAVRIPSLGVRMQWASVHIEVDPEIQRQAETRLRLRARAKCDWEDRQLRIAQAVTFRDLLREDPTLALAHLLLESPGTITGQAAISTIKEIGEQIAAYAPGAAWVKTAQLLEKSFGELPPDAKQFIIDRICRGLMEFRGGEEAANHIMQVHGILVQRATSNGRASDSENLPASHSLVAFHIGWPAPGQRPRRGRWGSLAVLDGGGGMRVLEPPGVAWWRALAVGKRRAGGDISAIALRRSLERWQAPGLSCLHRQCLR